MSGLMEEVGGSRMNPVVSGSVTGRQVGMELVAGEKRYAALASAHSSPSTSLSFPLGFRDLDTVKQEVLFRYPSA